MTPHLHHTTDSTPGIRRRRRGSSFTYTSPTGKTIHDPATLARIKSLVIPPAWNDVWISTSPTSHLQCTGRDARGRKQSRYHPQWRAARDSAKFSRVISFGQTLPTIRQITSRHLRLPGLPKKKILAAVVQCLEKTLIRIGNDSYASSNHSYGLTTIRDHHVHIKGSKVLFTFDGKSNIHHHIELTDPRLAKIIKASRDLPGEELFQYRDDSGKVHDIKSDDVNAYLHEITGEDFTAKDFRTWAGTVLAAGALQQIKAQGSPSLGSPSQRALKKNIVQAIERVAKQLGNTTSVCRKCYIHPVILTAYLDGSLLKSLQHRAQKSFSQHSLKPEESAVLNFLRSRSHIKHAA